MNKNILFNSLAIIVFLTAFCFGNEPTKNAEIESVNTEITKQNLKEKLGQKNVEFVDGGNTVNPLLLQISIFKDKGVKKFKLNNQTYKLAGLLAKLKKIQKEREKNQILLEETNEVDLRITLAAKDADILNYATNKITVEDFEKLVDALQANDFRQILASFDE